MMLLSPWVWLAALLALGGAYAGGRYHQHQYDQKAQMAAVIDATVKAREQEAKWQEQTKGLENAHQTEIERINAAHDAAIAGLRDRPTTRLPPAAKCADNATRAPRVELPAANAGVSQGEPATTIQVAGATGAQLSAPDAAFLTWLATTADRLASDLRSCQGWVKIVITDRGDK
jgi:hypothetical protein